MKSVSNISRLAKAKINLDLLITGRREDGYHLLDSLVVFADYGDEITVSPADELSLKISGPFAFALKNEENNLVLRAAQKLREKFEIKQGAHIHLVKNLPVASGIGGGSADAAATLLALMAFWGLPEDVKLLGELPLALGADVPICITGKALNMKGIGEIQNPIFLGMPLYLVLVNPGVKVPTADIFRARALREAPYSLARTLPDEVGSLSQLIDLLQESGNDLEFDAREAKPEITSALLQIGGSEKCLFHGMSGSGATCFGIFPTPQEAEEAVVDISDKFPDWWIKSVVAR